MSHTIEVSFFQGGGGAGLTLAWSSAERQKEIIPREMFLLNSNDTPLSLPKSNGCDLNKNLQISQIAVYDPFGDNVAVNAACDSSNAFMVTDRLIPYLPAGPSNALMPSSSCSLAVDGTLANREGKGVYQSLHADSDTVTYDLGADVLIKRIVYYNRKDCCHSIRGHDRGPERKWRRDQHPSSERQAHSDVQFSVVSKHCCPFHSADVWRRATGPRSRQLQA